MRFPAPENAKMCERFYIARHQNQEDVSNKEQGVLLWMEFNNWSLWLSSIFCLASNLVTQSSVLEILCRPFCQFLKTILTSLLRPNSFSFPLMDLFSIPAFKTVMHYKNTNINIYFWITNGMSFARTYFNVDTPQFLLNSNPSWTSMLPGRQTWAN